MAYQDSYDIQCPYCSQSIELEFDFSEGRVQCFEIECPVCCNPIDVEARHTEVGIQAMAERELQ